MGARVLGQGFWMIGAAEAGIRCRVLAAETRSSYQVTEEKQRLQAGDASGEAWRAQMVTVRCVGM